VTELATPVLEASGVIAVHTGSSGAVAALRGLDVTIRQGEICAVIGPSGAGKTTFLRLAAGLERPTAGRLTAASHELGALSDTERSRYRHDLVGIVEQHYRHALSPYLPVRLAVELPLAVRGMPPAARRARATQLLEAVGLGDRGDALPGELSGGEQQRVATAAAIAPRPILLLADEPTGELDAVAGAALLALLRELVKSEGATAVIVTHDPAVEAIADRVILLQDGRAVAERVGPPASALRPLVDSAGWRAPELTWASAPAPSAPRPAREGASIEDAASAAEAVVLDRVTRTYRHGRVGIRALRGISGSFASRGVHAVIGPSGSGKSTLMRLMAGLDRPDDGRVIVLGNDLGQRSDDELALLRARSVAVVEQARGLVPFLDARENVSLAARVRNEARTAAGATNDAAAEDIDALLERLGLADRATARTADLSAGERARLAVARALVGSPAILLIDEPTATLDRTNARAVASLLEALGADRSIIVATHDPAIIDVAGTHLELTRRS